MTTIYFATSNLHKRDELSGILNANGPRCILKIPADTGIPFNPVEDGASFAENSLIKARALWRLLHAPVIADDSGLCVDALDGRPGIFSARYGAGAGINLTAEQRNTLLLAELIDHTQRSARFVCAMTLLFDEHRFVTVQETLEGEIAPAPRGTGGFGYDPLLLLPERGLTVAELTPDEKNRISHRARAARTLRDFLPNAAS